MLLTGVDAGDGIDRRGSIATRRGRVRALPGASDSAVGDTSTRLEQTRPVTWPRAWPLAVAVLVAASCGGSGPPTHLSSMGRDLWNLEGLLHRTFDNRSVSSEGRDFDCAGDTDCAPHARYSPFAYTFVSHTSTAFHLMPSTFRPGKLGNFPEPILIRGRVIACDQQETKFLIHIAGTATYTIGCARPLGS